MFGEHFITQDVGAKKGAGFIKILKRPSTTLDLLGHNMDFPRNIRPYILNILSTITGVGHNDELGLYLYYISTYLKGCKLYHKSERYYGDVL